MKWNPFVIRHWIIYRNIFQGKYIEEVYFWKRAGSYGIRYTDDIALSKKFTIREAWLLCKDNPDWMVRFQP